MASVGYPQEITVGRRLYSYGLGGSPIGAQVNFGHNRFIEPFAVTNEGFLYFNHRMFGGTQFNFTAQFGGGVQIFPKGRDVSLDVFYKFHHISNANLALNLGMNSHMVGCGVSFFRRKRGSQ